MIYDDHFYEAIVEAPVLEEIAFRGILQPLIAKVITLCSSRFAMQVMLGMAAAPLISLVVTSILFGGIHYSNYTSGGKYFAVEASITSLILGIVKERFGFLAAVIGHVSHNYIFARVSKHNPSSEEIQKAAQYRQEQSDTRKSFIVVAALSGEKTPADAIKELGVDPTRFAECEEALLELQARFGALRDAASEEEFKALSDQLHETVGKLNNILSANIRFRMEA